MDPVAGKLAAAVEAFAQELIQEVGPNDDRGVVDDFIDMVTTNPRAGAGVEVTVLNLLQRMGKWQHPDKDINDHIHEQFAQMDGALKISYAEMATAKPIGWSASEWALREPMDGKWWLESIMLIPPKYHKFEGQRGRLTGVRYYPTQGVEFPIPYDKIVHVVNRRHVAALGDRPFYGVADCRLAIAAHKAWKIVINEALVAGQRQATPIIVGLADHNVRVPLYDDRGVALRDPVTQQIVDVPAPDKLRRELQSLNTNGGVITAGLGSEIHALNHQTDGRFFMELLDYLDRTLMQAFMVPYSVLENGVQGLGNAGLADAQISNMTLMLDSMAQQIQEEMLEKVIRPLITWNFGEQESYGEFMPPSEDEHDRIETLDALTRSFAAGLYSATDEGFVNRHRELAGIPKATELVAAMSKPVRYWDA